MGLRVIVNARKHDLPPVWDGRRVDWQGWSSGSTTAVLHAKPEPCEVCKSLAEPAVNLGLVYPLAGEMVTVIRDRTLKRSGRKISQEVEVPASAIIWLSAFRCPSCQQDTVHDRRDDTWWDLDDTDYGDDGSTDGALPGL